MNIYKIGKYTIAARNTDSAFFHYLDITDGGDITFFELDEGESDEYTISIKRLNEAEIDNAEVTCCLDGCEECEDREEPVLYSYRQMMEKQNKFPCVICREE